MRVLGVEGARVEVRWSKLIVPDGVTSSQSDPLRNWTVLLLGSGELLLRTEGLVGLYRGLISFC